MSLYQYLHKRTDIHEDSKLCKTISNKEPLFNANKIYYIEERVASWCEAWGIHKWFKLNPGGSQTFQNNLIVVHSSLELLLEYCTKILAEYFQNGEEIRLIDYESWLKHDIEYTVKALTEIIRQGDSTDEYIYIWI